MDVALSLVTGLGLRVYLLCITFPASSISPIILGLLEGILVHRLSFHPPPFVSSSPLDHYLALGLRFLVDFLIAGDWSRVKIVALWVAIGTSISELLFLGFPSNFDASVKTSPSSRTRRQRPRSNASHVPSRVRVYQEPEELPSCLPASTPIKPTIQVDTHASQSDIQTFISPNFPLPTPPSFFLHPESEPSPFPDSSTSSLKPAIAPVSSPAQTRPTSALAFYDIGKSTQPASTDRDCAVPSLQPSLLPPTPPDSTLRERTLDSRVDRLSTIDEITSRSEHVSEDIELNLPQKEQSSTLISHGGEEPLPVPNPTSHYVRAEDGTPMVSTISSTEIPLPVPPSLGPSRPSSGSGDRLRTPGRVMFEADDSNPDELNTPALQPCMSRNSLTPGGVSEPGKQTIALSPLILDSRTIVSDQEAMPVPGTTLSSYAILQPPVAPRPLGSLLDTLSNTILREVSDKFEDVKPRSDASDAESVLSTRIPTRLLEHAEDIRKQAIEEGRELERLKAELCKARSEHRPRDVLFLKGDIKDADERMKRLHAKAARRFFAGNTITHDQR